MPQEISGLCFATAGFAPFVTSFTGGPRWLFPPGLGERFRMPQAERETLEADVQIFPLASWGKGWTLNESGKTPG
jgi:hypothetical protein